MTRRRPRISVAPAALLAAALMLSGCTSISASSDHDETPPPEVPTLVAGTLTVAGAADPLAPFVIGDPGAGEGFESALVLAIAEKFRLQPAAVQWVAATPAELLAGGPKEFDLGLQRIPAASANPAAVDLAGPYFRAPQVALVLSTGAGAEAADIQTLRGLRLGAVRGTLGMEAITTTIAPERAGTAYRNLAAAQTALRRGRVDAVLVDFATAAAMDAVEDAAEAAAEPPADPLAPRPRIDILGAIDGSPTDDWVIVVSEANPIGQFVQAALDALETEGTLDALRSEWLIGGSGTMPLLR